jgi:phage head maturation protease
MQHKALRVADLKADDSQPGIITGRASTYDGPPDSFGDIVCHGAFTKTLQEKGGRIVVLSQHDVTQSIGAAVLTDKSDGLHCRIELLLDIAQGRYEEPASASVFETREPEGQRARHVSSHIVWAPAIATN